MGSLVVFSRTRSISISLLPCNSYLPVDDAEAKLRIRFYNATYNGSFGSIFATVDICALIPDEEADVCILEEPEHMNWMRVVDEDKGESTSPSASPSTSTRTAEQEQEQPVDSSIEKKETLSRSEIAKLGWAVKFTHVVGIIHTNYDAYVRQYGMGAAFLAASALHALSALVTRAYCHKVIRLSDTLPSLDKTKEVTCNVHGVRQEFLEQPQPNQEHGDESLNAIYFIGKLVRMLRCIGFVHCRLDSELNFPLPLFRYR